MVHAAESCYRQAVCVVALLLGVLTIAAEARANALAMALLRSWIVAVKAHTPGEIDEPAQSIAAWSQGDIDGIQRYLQTLIEFSVGKQRPSLPTTGMEGDLKAIRELAKSVSSPNAPSDFPKRAALLHTDIVMLIGWDPAHVAFPSSNLLGSSRTDSAGTPTMRVLGPDGRFAGYQRANPHWDIARSALSAIAPDEDVLRWYHLVASYFAKAYAFADLAEQLQAALLKAPDDPWLLYDSGCHQEALASPMIQDFVQQTTLPRGRSFQGMTSPSGHWQRAEAFFRRALAARSDFPEARLRLGRVLSQRDHYADAIAELDGVDATTSSPSLKYFANLFRADADRALGHYDRARASDETAVALYPRAQAARVALGHLLRETGDREGAMRVLEPALTAPATRPADDDPWWDYYRCEGPFVEQLYGEMIAPFLKTGGH